MSHKRDQTVILSDLCQNTVLSVHLHQHRDKIYLFRRLNNIPLNVSGRSTSPTHSHPLVDTMSFLASVLIVVNSTARNMEMQMSLWDKLFSFRCIPGRGIAVSHVSFTLNFPRHIYAVFHGGCADLHNLPNNLPKVLFAPYYCQYLLSLVFLILTRPK